MSSRSGRPPFVSPVARRIVAADYLGFPPDSLPSKEQTAEAIGRLWHERYAEFLDLTTQLRRAAIYFTLGETKQFWEVADRLVLVKTACPLLADLPRLKRMLHDAHRTGNADTIASLYYGIVTCLE